MLWPTTLRELWSWEPWEEMRRLQREMNRIFSGLAPSVARRAFPPVNVWTSRDEAVVTAELPGVEPGDIDISVVGDTLALRGERKLDELKQGESFTRQERPCGPFQRTVQLPFRVEPDKVEAAYARGVLTITLPRLDADKPKQIAVKTGE